MEIAKLQLAANSFNLTGALLNIINPASAVMDYSRELLKWLNRQGLDENVFEETMTLARGLAYPNANGCQIRESIEKANNRLRTIKVCPLPLVFSGSLGRLMVQEPEFCYMVSTVASLVTYHDLKFAKTALPLMILDQGGHEKMIKTKHRVQRAPVGAVISKLVDSIYLNVINTGHSVGSLPTELRHLHVHLLDEASFAATAMEIQRASGDLILMIDWFLADIIIWILNHFEGLLEISVNRQILLSQKLGSMAQNLSILIKNTCVEGQDKCRKLDSDIVLAEVIGNSTRTLLRDNRGQKFQPRSFARQTLYSTESLMSSTTVSYTSHKSFLNRNERKCVVDAAREISNWLLQIPLKPKMVATGLRIEVDPMEESKSDQAGKLLIADLFASYPTLCHPKASDRETGDSFVPHPMSQSVESSSKHSPTEWGLDESEGPTGLYKPYEVIRHFPIVQSRLDEIQSRCPCPNCIRSGPLGSSKRGCLRFSAITELFLLLAHVISDGFGAKDVSGMSDPTYIVNMTATLFGHLINRGLVCWDDWFKLVACVVTGCSADVSLLDFGAMQYGNLVILAPWLDLNRPCEIRGFFGLQFLEGSIKGIPDDLAFIDLEWDDFITPSLPDLSETPAQDPEVALEADSTKIETQVAIFPAGPTIFKLIIIVKTKSHIRMINPAQIIQGSINSTTLTCAHQPDQIRIFSETTKPIVIHDFDTIIGYWDEDPKDYYYSHVIVSQTLNQIQLNVALSLRWRGSILRGYSCCLACAVSAVTGTPNFFVINHSVHGSRGLSIEDSVKDAEAVGKGYTNSESDVNVNSREGKITSDLIRS